MRIFLMILTVLAFSVAGSNAAKADYYLWQDPKTGLSFSFPDSWKVVSSANPNDLVTIMAPSGRAHAACRLRANTDHRFLIYPQQYRDPVQRTSFSGAFWEDYLLQFENGRIYQMMDGAGLGRSHGSYAIVSYQSAVQGPYMNRMALTLAAHYYDRLYILECSSHRDAFYQWQNIFMSIAGSVDFKRTYHEAVTGNYRNFLPDPSLLLKGDQGMNILEY